MGYRVAVLSLCEHGEGGGLPRRDEGRGEKFHEGSHNAVAVDDTFVEPGRSGEARRKFLVQNVVVVAEQAGGGMIGREAARDARELLAFQSAKELANRRQPTCARWRRSSRPGHGSCFHADETWRRFALCKVFCPC